MATPHSTFGSTKLPAFAPEGAPEQERTLSHGAPAKKLFGVLPIMRLVPQDVHSMMDYANSGTFIAEGIMTDCPKARAASIVLGAAGAGVSMITDYRLSVAKFIPIEAHEVIDHAWGLMAIASPFVLGYWKSAPRVAMAHVIAGASNIIASLFTDYRAFSKRR